MLGKKDPHVRNIKPRKHLPKMNEAQPGTMGPLPKERKPRLYMRGEKRGKASRKCFEFQKSAKRARQDERETANVYSKKKKVGKGRKKRKGRIVYLYLSGKEKKRNIATDSWKLP